MVAVRRGEGIDFAAPSAEAALAATLVSRGLACDAGDVVWVDRPRGLSGFIGGSGLALVRAHPPGEPNDLYAVRVRLSSRGVLLGVDGIHDVTGTTGADEARPVVHGSLAAYAITVDGWYSAVHVLDFSGHAAPIRGRLTALERIQVALTNAQETGQLPGVGHAAFPLGTPARHAVLTWRDDGALEIRADDRRGHAAHAIVVDPREPRILSGAAFARAVPDERARPGSLVTWAVDRLRAAPWFGDERIQWLKAVVFTAADIWRAHFARSPVTQDRGAGPPTAPAAVDAEAGWPPAAMVPIATPALPGEGQWSTLDGDAFVTPTPTGTAPPLVTSFVRPNVRRPDVVVYVALWDPRRIALHIEAGTSEPVGAGGEHGPGIIPRAPEVMGHLVAAFNGGFQTRHGAFGMRADGMQYLPPRPYAATVMDLRDGSSAFGVWPDSIAVPDDVDSFRQNLTALVQDGRINPWGRDAWGGAPPGWPDQTHVTRSGLCLTENSFVAYFFAPTISPDDLGRGMLAARCRFGMHLDMNSHHVGFELYNVAPAGRLEPVGRPLQRDWEAEGTVTEMPGWVYRSRRLTQTMGHMLFPRYIEREARDFFYLTQRDVLPGPSIGALRGSPSSGQDSGEGAWRTQGLPQFGFPPSVASTWVQAPETDAAKLRVVSVDPRTLAPALSEDDSEPTVFAIESREETATSLWWSEGTFSIGVRPPVAGATRIAGGFPVSAHRAAAARAVAGVRDEDGMVVWVELPPGRSPSARTAAAMTGVLERLACSTRMALGPDARLIFGDSLDVAGDPAPAASPAAVRFVRATAPGARLVFTDTPIVAPLVWQRLQAQP
jgi:hypothetical protein